MADALHDIAALIDASKIEVGFAAIAVESGIEIAINGETLFPTASTFKVPLMVEVFAQARAGKFKISDRIAFTEPHRVIGARAGSPLILGVGQGETFLASDSPTSAFSAVFEDDGDCGYLYAWDRDLPESARILDAVMIYDVGRLPEQVHECEVDVEIIWSSDGRELR